MQHVTDRDAVGESLFLAQLDGERRPALRFRRLATELVQARELRARIRQTIEMAWTLGENDRAPRIRDRLLRAAEKP